MYLLLRFSPLLTSLLVFASFLVAYLKPSWFFQPTLSFIAYFGLLLSLFLTLVLIFIGAGYPLKTRLRFLPFLLITSLSAYILFLYSDNSFVIWAIIVILPAIVWIYLESLYLFWQRSSQYQAHTLQRIAHYLYIIEVFLLATALIGVQILLQVDFWIISSALAALFFAIQYDYFLLNKFAARESLVMSGLGTVMALEFSIVLNLLPTHFFMYGLIISLFFYVWLGISRQVLQRRLDSRRVITRLAIAGTGAVSVFITSLLIR